MSSPLSLVARLDKLRKGREEDMEDENGGDDDDDANAKDKNVVEPTSKKMRTLTNEEKEELEIYMELVTPKVGRGKNKRKKVPMPVEKGREECRWNRQVPRCGNREMVLARLIDGRLRGRLGLCPKCHKGRFKLMDDKAEYAICCGYYDETKQLRIGCNHKLSVKDVPRLQPWYKKKPTISKQEEMNQQEEETIQDSQIRTGDKVVCEKDSNRNVFEIAVEAKDMFTQQKQSKKKDAFVRIWKEIVVAIGKAKSKITKDTIKKVLKNVGKNNKGDDDDDNRNHMVTAKKEALDILENFLKTGNVGPILSNMRAEHAFLTATKYVTRKKRGEHIRYDWYANYKEPVVMALHEDETTLKEILNGQYHKIVIYFRSMDRYPGGNIDTKTIRFTYESDNDNKLDIIMANNWDGTLSMYSYPMETTNKMITQLHKVLLKQETSNAEFHIEDTTTRDNEEYNTEWSSIEVLVYDGEDYPILRLHQRCLMGSQYRPKMYYGCKKIDGTSEQKELIQKATELVKLGRVEDWDNLGNKQDCPHKVEVWGKACKDGKVKSKEIGHTYYTPISFPFP